MLRKFYSIIILSIGLVGLLFFFRYLNESGNICYLYIDPEAGNSLFIDGCDLSIQGIDKKGVTYFFLPSHVDISKVDQSFSNVKIYLSNGALLENPMVGDVQNVLVGADIADSVPWKIRFMKSENLHSIFLFFPEDDITNVSHDEYSMVAVNAYSPSGALVCSEEDALIKGRGNATWELTEGGPDKKPYQIKFNSKQAIGCIPPEKNWTLLANHYDGTGIINKMAFETAKKMDMEYITNSEWADVYSNGRYIGNYLICCEPQRCAGALLQSGGYLIEKNDIYYDKKEYGFTTINDSFTVKADLPMLQSDIVRLKDFIQLVDDDINDAQEPIVEHIDIDSFVKWYILEELFFNEDALFTSCFFYTSSDMSKLYAGPPWDFDSSCGSAYYRFIDYNGTLLTDNSDTCIKWYEILYNNSDDYKERLYSLYKAFLPVYIELVENDIDRYYAIIASSLEMNWILYDKDGYYPSEYTIPGYYYSDQNNIRYVKFFLSKRIQHLSSIWGIRGNQSSISVEDNSFHYLRFIYPGGREKIIKVKDGSQLNPDSFPSYDENLYEGWRYEANWLKPSYFLPIFEDTTFVLE